MLHSQIGVDDGVGVGVGVGDTELIGVTELVGVGDGVGQTAVLQILSIVVAEKTTAGALPTPVITYLFPLYSTPPS